MSTSTPYQYQYQSETPSTDWPAIVRVLLAIGVTAGALPLALGISLVFYVLGPRIEPTYLGLLVVGGLAVLVLTWNLGRRPGIRRWNFAIFALLLVAWGIATAILGLFRTNADVAIVAFYGVATLWMMWLAWIGFWPIGWVTKLALLAILGSLIFVFHQFVAVTGLRGDNQLRLAWRSELKLPSVAPLELDASAVEVVATPNDFPQYLGPERSGIVHGVELDPDWENRPPELVWRHEVGQGWGGFAIVGDYAFTQEQRGDEECVVCYELRTGEPVWVHSDKALFESQFGGNGPRATPAVHDGRVYTVGGTGLFHCLEANTGKLLWSHKLIASPSDNLSHGVCGSPLVFEDLVYVCPVASAENSLAAYDRVTGEQVFTSGGGRASYSSPAICDIHGKKQILTFNDQAVVSHDPKDGKILWSFDWGNSSGVNVAQPIAFFDEKDYVFLSTAYAIGAALLEVDLVEAGTWQVTNQWKPTSKSMKNKFCTSVLIDDRFVGLNNGILAAYDAKTGEQLWEFGRYGHGQILKIGSLVLVLTEEPPRLVLVNPARERSDAGELATFDDVLNDKTWNTLAFSKPYLLVRNAREAACIKLPCLGDEDTAAPDVQPPAVEAPPADAAKTAEPAPATQEPSLPVVPPVEPPAVAPPAPVPAADDPLPVLPLPGAP